MTVSINTPLATSYPRSYIGEYRMAESTLMLNMHIPFRVSTEMASFHSLKHLLSASTKHKDSSFPYEFGTQD